MMTAPSNIRSVQTVKSRQALAIGEQQESQGFGWPADRVQRIIWTRQLRSRCGTDLVDSQIDWVT